MSTSFLSSSIALLFFLRSSSRSTLSCETCSLTLICVGMTLCACLSWRSARRSFLSAVSFSFRRRCSWSCSAFKSASMPFTSMSSFTWSAKCRSASSPSRSRSLRISSTARSFCSMASRARSSVPAVRLCSSFSSFSFIDKLLFAISCSRIRSRRRDSCTRKPFSAFCTMSLCFFILSGICITFWRLPSSVPFADASSPSTP
mmetsp:Transcript_19952/g.64961  ORF Transcript_19952/g.64961 Transcript_19952/m.64961 type:complete len:202 (+) Transcript_19952:1649-2254(+)